MLIIKKAVKLGDILIPTLTKQEDIYYVTLCDQDLNPCVIVAFKSE